MHKVKSQTYKSARPARSCLSALAKTFKANPSKCNWSSGTNFRVFLSCQRPITVDRSKGQIQYRFQESIIITDFGLHICNVSVFTIVEIQFCKKITNLKYQTFLLPRCKHCSLARTTAKLMGTNHQIYSKQSTSQTIPKHDTFENQKGLNKLVQEALLHGLAKVLTKNLGNS